MERFHLIPLFKKVVLVAAASSLYIAFSVHAQPTKLANQTIFDDIILQKEIGFFRFNYDHIKMPKDISNMGLLGLTYFGDLTSNMYVGVGGYGSITGTQGGLFILGFAGGIHKQFLPKWWLDAGLFIGGGGGRSSLVGGGLMVRPSLGLEYEWHRARIGAHYSYISFPSGKIRSHQVGADLDFPFDFFYTNFTQVNSGSVPSVRIKLVPGYFLDFNRNDFAVILQSYWQKSGTRNVQGSIQDGRASLIGAELDHYFLANTFWYIKTSGAFSGIPNGYMDVLGGLGYKYSINRYGLSIIPQFGAGAGGGGNVDTGGGMLIQPQIGFEVPITPRFAARLMGGYLWAVDGELKAITATAALLYHLDFITLSNQANFVTWIMAEGWRILFFNQTYFHPQRVYKSLTSSINLVGFQIDQYITPFVFFSYQATSAYQGDHSGGYASGMIGPGIQTPEFLNKRLQFFSELFIGAGGGGSLSLGGGAILEPVIGFHFALTPAAGIVASAGQLKALHHDLNTTVLNIGLTIRFSTLNEH